MQLAGIPLTGLESGARYEGNARVDRSVVAPRVSENAFAEALKAELPSRQSQTSTVVPATRTALSSTQASQALREAWKAHFGEEPREETVAVLTAQWSHETGGGASMFNYNFGGIKGTGPSGLTVSQRTKEGWGATETTIRDNFRAYRSASEGAQDYIGLLRRRYAGALEAAHQGDPAGFVQGLKKNGYFTGNENAYVRSVSQKTAELLGHQPEIQGGALPEGIFQQTSLTSTQQPRMPTFGPSIASANTNRVNATRMQPAHFNASSVLPNTLNINAFDDALSRAALQIALDTPSTFDSESRKDRA